MIIRNEDVKAMTLEIPEGHKHIRGTLMLRDGSEWVFQEATIASLVRAYITLKTHPTRKRIFLKGERLIEVKEDYAQWQLLEAEAQEE